MTSLNTLVQSWVKSDAEFPVDFDLLWQGLGYSTKGNALRKLEQAEMLEGQDFGIIIRNDKNSAGAPTKHYYLSVDAAKALCMMAPTATGKQVRTYFIECERQLKQVLASAPVRSLSESEVMEIALVALQEKVNQDRYCKNKPGLRNLINVASSGATLSFAKASVEEICQQQFEVALTSGELNSLGRHCASSYRTTHNQEPPKEQRDINGRLTRVCVYGAEILPYVENWLTNKGLV